MGGRVPPRPTYNLSTGYTHYKVGSLHCQICPTMAFVMSHQQGSQSRPMMG